MSHTSTTPPSEEAGRRVRLDYAMIGAIISDLDDPTNNWTVEAFQDRPFHQRLIHALQAWVPVEVVHIVEPGTSTIGATYCFPEWTVIAYNRHIAEANTLPCGHRGFRNLGGGHFTCGVEWCESRFDRSTVAETFE